MILQDDIIKVLNEAGIDVLEIFHPICKEESTKYFATQSINFPQNNTFEYTIEGFDITQIIKEDSLTVQQLDYRNRTTVILTKMQELPLKKAKYSKDFSFIWHLCK